MAERNDSEIKDGDKGPLIGVLRGIMVGAVVLGAIAVWLKQPSLADAERIALWLLALPEPLHWGGMIIFALGGWWAGYHYRDADWDWLDRSIWYFSCIIAGAAIGCLIVIIWLMFVPHSQLSQASILLQAWVFLFAIFRYTKHMDHSYNSEASSTAYEEFLASTDGTIFRETIGNAFIKALPTMDSTRILDVGCGDGWLAGLLYRSFRHPEESATKDLSTDSSPKAAQNDEVTIFACDAGAPLIESAKKKYPNVKFEICDLNKPLPYSKDYFDVVTASMVIHDVEDEAGTLQNISAVLKPGGKLIATIVNPYYGYPIGEWKRGIVGRLLMKKPHLRLARFYNEMMRRNRPNFEWRPNLGSHFTPLSTHIRNAAQAGLTLTGLEDIQSPTDSNSYNLTYQLHRFPIILLLEFTKQ